MGMLYYRKKLCRAKRLLLDDDVVVVPVLVVVFVLVEEVVRVGCVGVGGIGDRVTLRLVIRNAWELWVLVLLLHEARPSLGPLEIGNLLPLRLLRTLLFCDLRRWTRGALVFAYYMRKT